MQREIPDKDLAEWKIGTTFVSGKLAEWSIAAVLKTVEPQGSGGSNPSLSASPPPLDEGSQPDGF